MMKLFSTVSVVLGALLVSAYEEAAQRLSNFKFMGASVAPYARKASGQAYFLLAREAAGRDKGTYDAFGGKKDKGEKHPVLTASRELAEESVTLLGDKNKLKKHIDVASGNTHVVIANVRKQFVVYVTKFHGKSLEALTKKFYKARNKAWKWCYKEKDKLAWVRWQDLKKAIASAQRDAFGRIIAPVRAWATVVEPNGTHHKQWIPLRTVFVSTMQPFFKGTGNYKVGNHPKIRFYN